MSLKVLKSDVYPNAIAWLDENPNGIAIAGERKYMGVTTTHILFSKSISDELQRHVIKFFNELVSAEKINLQLKPESPPVEHPIYLIACTRAEAVAILRYFEPATEVVRSPDCMEMISTDECLDRLKRLELQFGRPLSQVPMQQIGEAYRRLFP